MMHNRTTKQITFVQIAHKLITELNQSNSHDIMTVCEKPLCFRSLGIGIGIDIDKDMYIYVC